MSENQKNTTQPDEQTNQEFKELLAEVGVVDTLALFFSNIIVIVMALVQGWSVAPLLWVYWCQNGIIGLFNWLRMKQLKKFSTDGLKQDEVYVKPTKKSKRDITNFFLLHYGVFQLFYLFFLVKFTDPVPSEVVISMIIGVAIFLFNHAFSYRKNLKMDLSTNPNIGNMMFFPYFRVIPMHLVMFVGAWVGPRSVMVLLFFLLLKTIVDMLMHIIQHIDWSDGLRELPPGEKKPMFPSKEQMTLKGRIKFWFLMAWIALLVLLGIASLIVSEINRGAS